MGSQVNPLICFSALPTTILREIAGSLDAHTTPRFLGALAWSGHCSVVQGMRSPSKILQELWRASAHGQKAVYSKHGIGVMKNQCIDIMIEALVWQSMAPARIKVHDQNMKSIRTRPEISVEELKPVCCTRANSRKLLPLQASLQLHNQSAAERKSRCSISLGVDQKNSVPSFTKFSACSRSSCVTPFIRST